MIINIDIDKDKIKLLNEILDIFNDLTDYKEYSDHKELLDEMIDQCSRQLNY